MEPNWARHRVKNIPVPDKYWKRPEFSSQGGKEPEPIFEAIGFAVTSWEMVEDNFATLYSDFVESGSQAARRAYGTLELNSQRRKALVAAAEVYFSNRKISGEEKNEFGVLLEHCARASARRNEVAHGRVWEVMGSGCFLVPPLYNSRMTRAFIDFKKQKLDKFEALRAEYRYIKDDIVDYGRKFQKLGLAVISYAFHLRDEYESVRRKSGSAKPAQSGGQ